MVGENTDGDKATGATGGRADVKVTSEVRDLKRSRFESDAELKLDKVQGQVEEDKGSEDDAGLEEDEGSEEDAGSEEEGNSTLKSERSARLLFRERAASSVDLSYSASEVVTHAMERDVKVETEWVGGGNIGNINKTYF